MADKDYSSSKIPRNTKDRLKSFTNLLNISMTVDRKTYGDRNTYKKRIYGTCLTEEDYRILSVDNRPTLNFPTLKPYIMRSIKNIIDASPTIDIEVGRIKPDREQETQIPPEMEAKILTKKVEELLIENNWEEQLFQVVLNSWISGSGVIGFYTEYANNWDFSEILKFKAVMQPELIVFDSMDKSITKEGGRFVAELIPMTRADFDAQFPNASWKAVLKNSGWLDTLNPQYPVYNKYEHEEDVAIICDFYYKKEKNTYIYQLNTGDIVNEPPSDTDKELGVRVSKRRSVLTTKIYHCRFCGDIELKSPSETCFPGLPYIRAPAENYYIEGVEYVVPSAKQAIDAQRTKNFLMNFFLYEAYNHNKGTWMVPRGSLSDKSINALRDPSDDSVVEYEDYIKSPNNPLETLKGSVPTYIPTSPIPTQLLEAFMSMDATIEKILGNQFPSIDETNLSGKALYNMADFTSASNEVLVNNVIEMIRCCGQFIIDTLPQIELKDKVQVFQEDTEVQSKESSSENEFTYEYLFESGDFVAKVSENVNYKLQQQKNMEMLFGFAEASEEFSNFLFTEGMPFVISNMDFKNKKELLEAYRKYQREKQQEGPPPIEAAMMQAEIESKRGKTEADKTRAAADMVRANTDRSRLEIELDKLGHDKSSDMLSMLLEFKKTADEKHINLLNNMIEMLHIRSTDINLEKKIRAEMVTKNRQQS